MLSQRLGQCFIGSAADIKSLEHDGHILIAGIIAEKINSSCGEDISKGRY
jgi:hypothetical protein